MTNPLWGVLIGGGLTLAGTGIAEVVKIFTGGQSRKEARKLLQAEATRAAVREAEEAAATFQTVLREYARLTSGSTLASTDLRERYAAARSRFRMLIYRTPATTRQHLLEWEAAAVKWSQGDGNAADESLAWDVAVATCGEVTDQTFKG